MKITRVRVYQAVHFEGRARSHFIAFNHTDRDEPIVSVREDEKGVLVFTNKDVVRIGWPNISSIQYDLEAFLAAEAKEAKPKKA